MSSSYADKALLMEQYKDWVAETPNPESLPLTDVLLLALVREMQAQRYSTTNGQPTLPWGGLIAEAGVPKPKAPNHPY